MANPFDISSFAKERFGVDVSPEALKRAQEAAASKKTAYGFGDAISQFAAGMAGNPGGADEGIAKRNAAIDDETVGAYGRQQDSVFKTLAGDNMLEDRSRMRVKQSREDEEYAEDNDSASELSALAREAAKKSGFSAPDSASYTGIKKVYPFLGGYLDEQRARIQAQRQQQATNPYDAKVAAAAARIAQGLDPIDTQIPDLERASPDIVTKVMQGMGGALGRERTETRSRRLRGKPLEKIENATYTLRDIDDLAEDAQGWSTGLLNNRANALKWYAGLDDSTRTAVAARLNTSLANYIRSMSGLAVNEGEAARLNAQRPNPDDKFDTLMKKLEVAQQEGRRIYQSALDTYTRADYDMGNFREQAEERGWLGQTRGATAGNLPGGHTSAGAADLVGLHRDRGAPGADDVSDLLEKYK